MTVTGPCSLLSAVQLALTPAMVMIVATVILASSWLLESCRAGLPLLDGEVIMQDGRRVSDFEALQSALRSQPTHLIFYNFDLLYLDGKDLREKPLLERRTRLRELVGRDSDSRIQFSEEFIGDAVAFFRACAAHELEGIVSKLAISRYRSGRSKTWLKTKCFNEGEFLQLGIDRDRKTDAPRALLAKAERGNLIYAGAAFIGLRGEKREELQGKAKGSCCRAAFNLMAAKS
jgi:bifunctional non-homologous end joining protein LigD